MRFWAGNQCASQPMKTKRSVMYSCAEEYDTSAAINFTIKFNIPHLHAFSIYEWLTIDDTCLLDWLESSAAIILFLGILISSV